MNKPWENFKYNPFNRKKKLSGVEETDSVFEQLKRHSGEDLKKPLTRAENRLTHKGKFEIDPETRKLTPTGKTDRLKYRLNWAILWLVLGCVITWLVLFFL